MKFLCIIKNNGRSLSHARAPLCRFQYFGCGDSGDAKSYKESCFVVRLQSRYDCVNLLETKAFFIDVKVYLLIFSVGVFFNNMFCSLYLSPQGRSAFVSDANVLNCLLHIRPPRLDRWATKLIYLPDVEFKLIEFCNKQLVLVLYKKYYTYIY